MISSLPISHLKKTKSLVFTFNAQECKTEAQIKSCPAHKIRPREAHELQHMDQPWEKAVKSPQEEGVTPLRRQDMAKHQRSPALKISLNGA
jgi:hypothetical protein